MSLKLKKTLFVFFITPLFFVFYACNEFGQGFVPAAEYSDTQAPNEVLPPQETTNEDVKKTKPNSLANIEINYPSAGINSVTLTDNIKIQFEGNDPDGETIISLYYSNSFIECSNHAEDDWFLISEDISSNSTSYDWSAPYAGIYYFCAKIKDVGGDYVYNSSQGALIILPSDSELWLSADYGVVTDTSNKVSLWQDRSGKGHDATQNTESYKPILETASINYLPAIKFDGINDFFKNEYSYNATTVYAVVKVDSSLQNSNYLGQVFGDYTSGTHLALDARTGNLRGVSLDGAMSTNKGYYAIDDSNFSGLIANSNAMKWEYDTVHVLEVEFEQSRSITTQAIAHLAHSFSVGDHHFGGYIAEIIVFNKKLEIGERQLVRNYLDIKWLQEGSELAPPDPVNVSATGLSSKVIKLKWKNGGIGTAGYIISYNAGNDAPETCTSGFIIQPTSIGTATIYSVSGLDAETTYSFRICAINSKLPYDISEGTVISSTTLIEQDLELPFNGMVLWLKADEILESGSVSIWEDKSGSDNHAIQTSAANMPKLIDDVSSGLAMVQFDGVDDFLQGQHDMTVRTVLAVFRVNSSLQKTSQLGQIWGQYGTVGTHVATDPRTNNLRGWSFDGNTSNRAGYAMNDNEFSDLVADSNAQQWTYDVPAMVTAVFSSNRSLNLFLMGTLGTPFSVGQHQYGGEIGEVIVYDRELSEQELIDIKLYLMDKWNLY